MVSVSDVLGDMYSEICDVFDTMEWAEDEIRSAQERWPDQADVLFHSFRLIRPPSDIHFPSEVVYRAYARELLERVAQDVTTVSATAVEILLALQKTSLIAPLSSEGVGLYVRMWEAAKLPQVEGISGLSDHYDAIMGSRLDVEYADLRMRLARADRVQPDVIACEGVHHGVAVTCRFAESREYDENNECTECGAHIADPHAPSCPHADSDLDNAEAV